MKVLFIFLFCVPILALELDQSIICTGNNVYTYQGIQCCLEDLDQNLCRELIDNFIPAENIERAGEVRSMIDQGDFSGLPKPNCHDTAVAYIFPDLLPISNLQDDLYIPILENMLTSIEHEQLMHGDLVIYDLEAQEVIKTSGNDPFQPYKSTTRPVKGISHSAIYLLDGLVFQKESSFTKIYTISSLQRVQKQLKIFLKSSLLKNVQIKLRYFSKRK